MGISTHILDTTRGKPAADVAVRLERLTALGPTLAGEARTDADGRVKALLAADEAPSVGEWRITFSVGEYFEALGVEAFYRQVQIQFTVRSSSEHYHVPLLLNPFGYSTYRGS
jgi:5-hydroxyisourate hydrolase